MTFYITQMLVQSQYIREVLLGLAHINGSHHSLLIYFSGGKQSYKTFIGTSHGHTHRIIKQIAGIENVPVETVQSRRDPFPYGDIASTPF